MSSSIPASAPDPCNILLIGGGGREHALAWKLRQSPRLGKLWLTDKTNAGLAALGEPCPIDINIREAFRAARWCDTNDIHLVLIGPEAPLAEGFADALRSPTRHVFGPSKAAAQLEADKAFAKQLMRQAAIPTAEARIFTNHQAALSYVQSREDPCVVKAAGLAAGKGVIVCDTPEEAADAVNRMMLHREFGDAADKIIIEEKLAGQEVSILALVDGRTISLLDTCQDHKQRDEGDTGPNTGGMGAYSPTPLVDAPLMDTIQRQIIVPTIDALRREGIEYRGVLYAGLMLTPAGPKVLEFNCRLGDPECQVIMPRLQGDLIEILWATAAGKLSNVDFDFDPRVAVCVVMCSAGYPGPYETGKPITGIEDAQAMPGVTVFHAGTKIDTANQLVTNGGRVLAVTALGNDLTSARDLANAAAAKIHFPGAFYRKDIGSRVLTRVSS